MGIKKPDLISALVPLVPRTITNLATGEIIETSEFSEKLEKLTGFVRSETERLWNAHKETLESELGSITATSPAEIGRQAGVYPDVSVLPREVKAKSRIERLIRYQLITSAKSYYNSDVEEKQEPTFSPYLNLGAIDAQMAVTTFEHNKVELFLKCWDTEYLLTFELPDYVMTRDFTKITLPIVKPFGQGWGFIFSIHERSKTPLLDQKYVMGIDLGIVEPYTLVVVHVNSGSRVAQYTASPRLRYLLGKRDRLNTELGHLYHKSAAYSSLGLQSNPLRELERALTRSKRNRLNDKITWLIATEIQTAALRWSPRFVSMEDLAWVSGTKKAKIGMSRWAHSKHQKAITHKIKRSGIPTKKVNAKNTSQDCNKCGEQVVHMRGKRLVHCSDCSLVLDRDLNAAHNIALRPLPKRSKGTSSTVITEARGYENNPNKRLLTRITS